MEWLILLITILGSVGVSWVIAQRYYQPRVYAAKQIDEETAQFNEELQKTNRILTENKIWLEDETKRLTEENSRLLLQKNSTIEQINTLNSSITAMEKQAQEAADLFYNS